MRTCLRLLALATIATCTAACATATQQLADDNGRLTIGVTTTGDTAKALTFQVTVQPAGLKGEVNADAGVFINDHLPSGEHVVRLAVPAACKVDGGPERTITISQQRRSAVLRFEVRCP